MPLPLLFRHLVFSSSHRLLSSDPTIRVCLCGTAVTQSSCPYNHLTGNIAIIAVGLPSSHRRRFTSALSTYPENPRVLFSHTHKSSGTSPSRPPQPYLSTPILNPNNGVLQGEVSLPPFGCPRGYLVAWPHRLCLRPRHCAASLCYEWRFADLYYTLRPSFPSVSQTSTPRRDS